MEFVEFTAKTVDDAITAACQKFLVTSDRLEYEVMEEGSSGFLGFNSKPARIRAKVKETLEDKAKAFLDDVFTAMNMTVLVEVSFDEEEKVMDIERTIGADIMMAFDECPPGDSDYEYAKKSLGLTHRWLDRCIQRFNETEPKYGYRQSLFPIVQGCVYRDLRTQSAEFVASKEADGNAIGGLAVGEPVEKMYEMIELVNGILPKDKPRYLMGVGTPVNILEGIERGVDMFDCVMPTRNGRNGMIFTKDGILNMRNKKWEADFSPIEADGASYVDTLYTKAYLRHLFHAQEMLAMQIASVHNLAFYLWLVGEARKHIIAGDFAGWKSIMVKRLSTRL